MKRILSFLYFVSHGAIILSLYFLIFIGADWYNPLMGLMEGAMSSWLLIAFCLVSLAASVENLLLLRRLPPAER